MITAYQNNTTKALLMHCFTEYIFYINVKVKKKQ